jgi:glycosyltransferase involved in cell wall biosynthesis
MNFKKVSVIIPSYNRFKFLLHAIKSVKEQTHKNVQIIVINDASTEKEYKEFNFEELGVYIIHLEENSYKKFGYSNLGYVRNQGIQKATGDYVAFLDDDDYWLPTKLEEQLKVMATYDCKMSSTNGYFTYWNKEGGLFNINKIDTYRNIYNFNHIFSRYLSIPKTCNENDSCLIEGKLIRGFNETEISNKGCPNIFISSSVIVDRKLLAQVGNYSEEPPPGEDIETWIKILKHTECVLVNKPLMYYDTSHGNGQQWETSDKSRWKPMAW